MENEVVKQFNVNFVGDFKQDAFSAVRAFRLLRKQDFFKAIDKKNYIVWSDCGKHFRCSEFISYLMEELAGSEIHVNLNFFGEAHGKNSRDQHFSVISNFIKQAEYTNRLMNTQDVIDAVLKGQERSNFFRKEKGKKFLLFICFFHRSV